MIDLELNEQRTLYPRVSDVTSPFSAMYYGKVPPDVLLNAANRGTQVHSHCAALIRGDFVPSPSPEVQAYVDCFARAWQEIQPATVALCEKRLYDDALKFTGQVDILLEDGCLVDIKTSSKPSPLWGVQLAAYAGLAQANNLEVTSAAIVQVGKRSYKGEFKASKPQWFRWKISELDELYNQMFVPALRWWNFMKEETK